VSQRIEYFAAASDKAAAAFLASGPGDDGVPAPDLDPAVVLANLESILTGVDEDVVLDNPRLADLVEDSGNLSVVTVTDELRDALVVASSDDLADATESLAEMEELEGAEPDEVNTALEGLAELAREATATNLHLYCWLSQ
jgi:hypothetical protein